MAPCVIDEGVGGIGSEEAGGDCVCDGITPEIGPNEDVDTPGPVGTEV